MTASVASLSDSVSSNIETAELLLLPGFDEYLFGYKDRSAMIYSEHCTVQALHKKANLAFEKAGHMYAKYLGVEAHIVAMSPTKPR